jgi:hypothetical protein
MKLTGDWTVVAQRRNKDAPWAWALDALERVMLTKMTDEGKADVRIEHRPAGIHEMQARDRAAAILAKALGAPMGDGHVVAPDFPPEPVASMSVESPAAPVGTPKPPAPRPRRWRVPVVRLPPARPIGARTYVPHHSDPARW